jgi:hypothetical protein
LSLVAVALLGLVSVAKAAPLDARNVPAGATWVIHVDVDAICQSTIVKNAYAMCLEKHKDAVEKAFAKIREHVGMDPRKDLHGITLFGPKIGQHKGAMLIQATLDQKVLGEKVKKAQDYRVSKYGAYEISSWTAKSKKGTHGAAGAFAKSGMLVLADSVESVMAALDVLDGKQPSMAKGSPLVAGIPAGATVVARITGIAEAVPPGRSPLPKQIESLSLAMGENQGQSFLSAKLVTKTSETAAAIKTIIEGGKALAQLRHMGDAEASKLIDQVKVSVSGTTVAVDFRAPVSAVWAHLQKVAKELQAMHQHAANKPAAAKPAPAKK